MDSPALRSFLLPLLLAGPAAPASATTLNYNNELREKTGENFFARNVYICAGTVEQCNAVPLPDSNWEKNYTPGFGRLFLPDSGSNVPPAPPDGYPASLDLIAEIPGDDHLFIARVLSGAVLGFNAQGGMVRAQVARDTTFTYEAGRVIHTLLSNTGVEYILFSIDAGVTPENPGATVTWDPFALNGLAGLLLPTGWSYASQVLTQARTYVVPGGIADVVSLLSGAVSFQQAVLVPEPAAGALLALGLACIAWRRRL